MKRIKNFLISLVLIGGTGITVFATTSCSSAPDMKKHIEYIAQHEFSFSAWGYGGPEDNLTAGTAWICDRIGTTGYQYYLTTNYHVTINYSEAAVQNYYFYFIDPTTALTNKEFDIGPNIDNGKYGFSLTSDAVSKQEATGIYHSQIKTDAATYTSESADVALLKVDFASVVDSNDILKAKLDSINDLSSNIVNYRNSKITDDDWTYIAGFGQLTGFHCQWQYAADEIYETLYPGGKNPIHPVTFTNDVDPDISATNIGSQYLYPSGNMDKKLNPGTSGSMAIDQNNNIVGIHWGEMTGPDLYRHEGVCFLTGNKLDPRLPGDDNIINILESWIEQQAI